MPTLPELLTYNKVVLPDTIWNEELVNPTDAVTLPVAICDKLSPTTAEAGT